MSEAAMLNWVLFLPVVGMAALLVTPRSREDLMRGLSLALMTLQFVLALALYLKFDADVAGLQFETRIPWIADWGVYYHVGLDGLNILLVLLTAFLGPLVVAGAFSAVTKDVKLFYSMVFLIQLAMMGTFLAQDLFLFYVFWETMLIPMFLIIGIWGGERRIYATLKFVLYTAFGSILMLAAVIYLVWSLKSQTGIDSFAFADLYRAELPLDTQVLLFGAFALSFAIKVPVVPLHTWLPDAHVEAPTAGSVILAGVLLKMGTYGFIKLGFPLFPAAMEVYTPAIMVLAVVSIIYGACLALVQDDIKKIIAYSSISHLGYVMLGLASLDLLGIQGAIIQMVSHGLTAGGLFLMVGMIYERTHSRAPGRLRRPGKAAAGVFRVLHDPDAGRGRPADHQRLHRRVPGADGRVQRRLGAAGGRRELAAGAGLPGRAGRGARGAVHAAPGAGLPVRREQGAPPAAERPEPAREGHPGGHRRGDLRAGAVPRLVHAQDRAGRAAVPAAGPGPCGGHVGGR